MEYSVVTSNNNYIIQDDCILLQHNITKECEFIQLNPNIIKNYNLSIEIIDGFKEPLTANENSGQAIEKSEDTSDSKIWTKRNSLFLIDKIKEYDYEFSSGVKKNVWLKVASECKLLNQNITWKMCETKFKSLKRTYKAVLQHNSTSGQKKKFWEYFDVMHELMFNKPEITPVATCSNISGLQVNNNTSSETLSAPSFLGEATSSEDSSFTKKRKVKISNADKRHKEKMARMDRFNDLFEKMIEKI